MLFRMWFLSFVIIIFPMKFSSAFDIVKAVVNKKLELPCNLSENVLRDDVILVLWYKSGVPHPIYSLDARGGSISTGNRFSSPELGKRGYFNLYGKPPVLQIYPVEKEDTGTYRCRIDFKRSPTINFEIGVDVIVPPRKPVIRDKYGTKIIKKAGPFDEGKPLVLVCESSGGIPQPTVRWILNGKLIDNTSRLLPGNVVKNELLIKDVGRNFLSAVLKCEASNTNLSDAQSTKVIIDVNLNPTSVRIIDKPLISAGKWMELICIAKGSHPPAKITWWLGSELMKHSKVVHDSDGQSTSSKLRIKLTSKDNEKFLSCRAENPVVASSAMEDGFRLDIHYVPVLTLSVKGGRNEIQEGRDIYFECKIRANPRVNSVGWKFEGRPIMSNTTGGVSIFDQSLVLTAVNRDHSGLYSCTASNSEGTGESQSVPIVVQYAPSCASTDVVIRGAALHELVHLYCNMVANPPDIMFSWTFVSSSTGNVIPFTSFSSDGNESRAVHTLTTSSDYGNLTCYGRNSVGKETSPCRFSIVVAGPPSRLQNCSVINKTSIQIVVSCDPGFDGGLKQIFHMEILKSGTNELLKNTSSMSTRFVVNELPSGTELFIVLYSSNAKGRSGSVSFIATTEHQESYVSGPMYLISTPILTILIGIVCGMLLVLSIIVVTVKIRHIRRIAVTKMEVTTTSSEKSSSSPEKDVNNLADNSEGKSPDIIPTTRCTTIADLSHSDCEFGPVVCAENYPFDFTNVRSEEQLSYPVECFDAEIVLVPTPLKDCVDIAHSSADNMNYSNHESSTDRQRRIVAKHVEPPTVPLQKLQFRDNRDQVDDDSGISAETPLMVHKLESVV